MNGDADDGLVSDSSHAADRRIGTGEPVAERGMSRLVAPAFIALFAVGLGVFVAPFAFPTPPPIVKGFRSTLLFSPNADGSRDVLRVAFRLNEAGTAAVTITDRDQKVWKTLVDGAQPAGIVRASWDGTDAAGQPVPDGRYIVSLRARAGKKQFNVSRATFVDRQAPPLGTLSVQSSVLAGPGEGQCRAAATALDRGQLAIEAAPIGDGAVAIARFGPKAVTSGASVLWSWDGTRADGAAVEPGLYAIRATLADGAKNTSRSQVTCWVGNAIGTSVPGRPTLGTRVGVRLRRTDGSPLPPATRVTLEIFRRVGDPGGTGTAILGRKIGSTVSGPMNRLNIQLPRRIPARLLWLVASTPDARVLIPLRP